MTVSDSVNSSCDVQMIRKDKCMGGWSLESNEIYNTGGFSPNINILMSLLIVIYITLDRYACPGAIISTTPDAQTHKRDQISTFKVK